MREYAKLAPTFWTGETGRALRRRGSEGVIVALYLVSSPHSNMLGLFYQPILYMAHETGLGIEGASKGLQDCIECDFCSYDKTTEMVFVHEMAKWQVSASLTEGDKRCKGLQKDYDALPANPFLGDFFDRYKGPFHLTRCRSFEGAKQEVDPSPSQAPSKPHRSQEQEQEQEQERDTGSAGSEQLPPASPKSKDRNRTAGAHLLPEAWTPKPGDVAKLAAEFGIPASTVSGPYVDGFRDVCTAKGYRYRDFDAAFRNCVRQDWPRLRTGRPSDRRTDDLYAGAI